MHTINGTEKRSPAETKRGKGEGEGKVYVTSGPSSLHEFSNILVRSFTVHQ